LDISLVPIRKKTAKRNGKKKVTGKKNTKKKNLYTALHCECSQSPLAKTPDARTNQKGLEIKYGRKNKRVQGEEENRKGSNAAGRK